MKRSSVPVGAVRLILWCAVVLLGPASRLARAEFTVGSEVPAFSLQSPDGKTVSFERRSGEAQLTRDGKSEKPKLIAIHLLQPDCLQCRAQLKALEQIHRQFAEKGLVVLGVSHREDAKALAAMGAELKISFPLLVGGGSDLAKQFAAGDTFGLIDAKGIIRFAQVGYGAGDEKVWTDAVEKMLAGKAPTADGVDRERLKVGDSFPAVTLPSLRTDKPMALVGKGGRLVYRSEDGKETKPLCTIFFFSRY